MYFNVRSHRVGLWTVVTVVGEIDLATVPQFRAEAHNAVSEADALALDLTECGLVDSTALGVIVGIARRVREASIPFRIVPSDAASVSFQRSRLDEILDFADSVESLGALDVETAASLKGLGG